MKKPSNKPTIEDKIYTPIKYNLWEEVLSEVISIVSEKDYSYLLEKPLEDFSFDELKFLEKLFTKQNYNISEKRKELQEKLKKKFWAKLIYNIYDKLIKIKLKENIPSKIRTLLKDENNNTLCWKYKTCNSFWIPFWLQWNNFKVLPKIDNDEIHMLWQLDADYDDDWIYMFWQYSSQEWQRFHFWFDKNKNEYVSLKEIEWEKILNVLYPLKNKRWKILYGKYKNVSGHIIPFWYSNELEKYISLKIDWEIICDTANRIRKNWKLVSWIYLNDKWYRLPFWFEWNEWKTLKIEWEEIRDTRNRKRDESWKLASWEFLNVRWVWQKFKLEWWKYIIKTNNKSKWLLSFFNIFKNNKK